MSLFCYKVIIFDFDGTLIDSAKIKTDAFEKIYQKYGTKIVEKVIDWHKKNEGVSRYIKFKYWHENFLKIPCDDEDLHKLCDQFSSIISDKIHRAPYIEGAYQFLSNNFKKLDFYIVSGTPESELKNILMKRKINHFFVDIFGSPENKFQILQKIISNSTFIHNQILVVGDALSDLDAANAAGVDFCGMVTVDNVGSLIPKNCKQVKNFFELERFIQKS